MSHFGRFFVGGLHLIHRKRSPFPSRGRQTPHPVSLCSTTFPSRRRHWNTTPASLHSAPSPQGEGLWGARYFSSAYRGVAVSSEENFSNRAGTAVHEKRGQYGKEHTEQGCALKSTDADSGRVALPKRSRCKSEAFLHTFFAGKKYGLRSKTPHPS